MRKVNSAAFSGFLLCFGAIVFGIITNGGIGAVWNLIHIPSAIVTFGGALFAVMITADSMQDFGEGLKSFIRAFQKKELSVYSYADMILELSNIARREGLLSLESKVSELKDEFLKRGIMLIVDGSAPDLVKDIMEAEMLHKEDNNRKNVRFWQDLGSYAPAWGMVGTLLGLINMLRNMGGGAGAIGSGMALALITTLYGSVLANWICIPLARKLEKCSDEEMLVMEMCTEGVLSIQAGENPRIIQEKIRAIMELEIMGQDAEH